MKPIQIYIDINFPSPLVKSLEDIHALQSIKKVEVFYGTNSVPNPDDLNRSIVVFVDYEKKGVSIPIRRYYEDGYRVIVCKAGRVEKIDRFEMAMTVLRTWPSIIEKAKENQDPFLYAFNYQGRVLKKILT